MHTQELARQYFTGHVPYGYMPMSCLHASPDAVLAVLCDEAGSLI